MLQIQRIRQQPEAIIEGLKKRGIDATQTVNDLIDLDAQRRGIRHQMEEQQARSNALAKEIGQLFKSGKGAEANELKAETGALKQEIKALKKKNTTSSLPFQMFLTRAFLLEKMRTITKKLAVKVRFQPCMRGLSLTGIWLLNTTSLTLN